MGRTVYVKNGFSFLRLVSALLVLAAIITFILLLKSGSNLTTISTVFWVEIGAFLVVRVLRWLFRD